MVGDGHLDVVAAVGGAKIGGLSSVGALYSWRGGPGGFAGAVSETARYSVSGAAQFDMLAYNVSGQAWWIADLDGDSVLDLLALAPNTDFGGKKDVGVLRWWRGPLQPGDPTATLSVPGAVAGDWLGY